MFVFEKIAKILPLSRKRMEMMEFEDKTAPQWKCPGPVSLFDEVSGGSSSSGGSGSGGGKDFWRKLSFGVVKCSSYSSSYYPEYVKFN